MKITVNHTDLTKSITTVISAVNQRSSLPILANVLIETLANGTIQLTGTDLEIGISRTCAAEIIEEGAITLPAKKFHDIIRECPKEKIEISVAKNNAVTIKSGKAYFKLMGLTRDDFPRFPNYSKDSAIIIDSAILHESITLTSFAISSDETRYVLNGALLKIKDKKMTMVATDGRRLAVIEKALDIAKGIELNVIIPTKALAEINKNVADGGKVSIIDLGNQLLFIIDDTVIISRLIEGHFPNYEQVIPTGAMVEAVIDRQTFLSTIRRVSLLTSLESQAIKVDLINNNKVILSSRAPNVGESKEEIEVNNEHGAKVAIGFNPHYLTDVLKCLDMSEVTLRVQSADKPGVIAGKDGYTYVIMPMQIS